MEATSENKERDPRYKTRVNIGQKLRELATYNKIKDT